MDSQQAVHLYVYGLLEGVPLGFYKIQSTLRALERHQIIIKNILFEFLTP